ncbi:mastermind-like protein 3 isoform X1 [Pygocentrus nattereri]|uniref:Neurogenic mastermind-like N-terminal domain-containing protein n=1 Tax=Pygocentrus nattereri TaxID=42514 RepID=A0A3B4CCR9_PYGNA|nr:mastermind-like protein 3 isoform X1 [Pygocentrus nattereri]
MMGDFASPATANGGGSLCINSAVNLNAAIGASSSGGGGANSGSAGNNSGSTGVPKHSTVVERLRQRIEGCRRHHVTCETRYQQAHAEQLEIERRETAALYQRSLEQRAKKAASGGSKQGKQQQQEPDPAAAAAAEQRSSTLIALQETVKRKLDNARSPLNGDQNGICDGSYSPTTKRLRKEGNGGLDSLSTLSSSVPPISPLHQMDIKPTLPTSNNATSNNNAMGNGNAGTNHITGRTEDLGKNGGMPDIKLNGSLDLDDGFSLLKDIKPEPLDDPSGIESSDTSLSNQNKLFSDINLNDQEWQELIDELANTVPEDDMHDLFNEDFEEKKEVSDFARPASEQTQQPQEPAPPPVAAAPNNPPQTQSGQMSIGSPQVRPASSGPPFATAANGTPPQQPLQQSPAVAMASGSPANCIARSPQTPTQAQTQTSRPGNGFMINPGPGVGHGGSTPIAPGGPGPGGGSGPVPVPVPPTTELSPAEQLKQMAAQQQQRAKLIQQKHQQQSQAASWSPAGAPTSPYGGPFNPDKPNSPMMYPQAFNAPNSMMPKAGMNNYLPQNHMNMLNQQQQQQSASMAAQNALNKQLSYSNTKPLSHFSGVDHMSQRMTPPMANQAKNPIMPYMQGAGGQGGGPPPAQGPIPGQTAHLTEEQKRMMMMKQKVLGQSLPYSAIQQHAQEQGMVGMPRQASGVQPPHGGPGGVASAGPNGAGPGAGPGGYLGNQQQQQQQQAAMMKQMMAMEQEKRVQLHMMEQQKAQLLREQRQQQHHLLAEQLQQQQQQQHLPRQMSQAQRNPYPLQQFQGPAQEMVARNQALQNMRNARLLQQQQQQQQQSQGILQMTPVQNSGPMPGQGEMGVAYGSQASGQTGMYQGMNSGMGQMLQPQHHPNQGGMGMGQRPSGNNTQGMVAGGAGGGGYGQGMLMNPALSQQQMKPGGVGQPMAKAQAQRLQSMMGGGGQGWPQQQQQQPQNLQAMGGRTTNDMVAFNSNYPMQGGQPSRMPKQHFAQGMGGQGMVDPRAMNPAGMGGPMMPHMAGQPRTGQPRGMVMPGMSQGSMPNMTAFGQGSAQAMPGAGPGGGAYMSGGQPQGYQRTSNQDLAYGYGAQSGAGGGVSFGLSDGAELDSTDGWMEDFFSSQ